MKQRQHAVATTHAPSRSVLEEAIDILEACELKTKDGERLIDLSLRYLERKHRLQRHPEPKLNAPKRFWQGFAHHLLGKTRNSAERYLSLSTMKRIGSQTSRSSLVVQRALSYDAASAMLFAEPCSNKGQR